MFFLSQIPTFFRAFGNAVDGNSVVVKEDAELVRKAADETFVGNVVDDEVVTTTELV